MLISETHLTRKRISKETYTHTHARSTAFGAPQRLLQELKARGGLGVGYAPPMPLAALGQSRPKLFGAAILANLRYLSTPTGCLHQERRLGPRVAISIIGIKAHKIKHLQHILMRYFNSYFSIGVHKNINYCIIFLSVDSVVPTNPNLANLNFFCFHPNFSQTK